MKMLPLYRTGLAALSITLAASGCHRAAEAPQVRKAWVRLPAVPGQPAAAYFTLTGGRQDDALVKVESALATRAELHESMAGGGHMMTMKPLEKVAVMAGGTVAFAPGGFHVMLFGVEPIVRPGTAIPLRFGFAGGKTAEAEAKTVKAGDPAPY